MDRLLRITFQKDIRYNRLSLCMNDIQYSNLTLCGNCDKPYHPHTYTAQTSNHRTNTDMLADEPDMLITRGKRNYICGSAKAKAVLGYCCITSYIVILMRLVGDSLYKCSLYHLQFTSTSTGSYSERIWYEWMIIAHQMQCIIGMMQMQMQMR